VNLKSRLQEECLSCTCFGNIYVIDEVLNGGGYSIVFKAFDRNNPVKPVVIKMGWGNFIDHSNAQNFPKSLYEIFRAFVIEEDCLKR
jgi:hypothetical protein